MQDKIPPAQWCPGPHTADNWLDRRASTGKPLLTCYFPIGDPLFDDDMLALYARCGVDILELGVPSADPFMDGADVAGSMQAAIASGIDIGERIRAVAGWLHAEPDRPAGICMAYADMDYAVALPPENRSLIDGLLLLGLEAREDAATILADAKASEMRLIRFVSTRMDEGEVAAAREADGYVMLQARAGITGPSADTDPGVAARISALRSAGVRAPILSGFGISTPEQAAEAVAMGADGVIIGSMCIRKVREGTAAIEAFLRAVRAALDA